jgi:hypothetical protein
MRLPFWLYGRGDAQGGRGWKKFTAFQADCWTLGLGAEPTAPGINDVEKSDF